MLGNTYTNFLKMLDFSEREIALLASDWQMAAQAVGLSEDDIVFAMKEWIPQNWDLRFRGVRKCIGAYIKEFIEIAKIKQYRCEGVKLIYGTSPSQPICFRAVKLSGGDKVYVGYPDFLLAIILNAFFKKLHQLYGNEMYLSDRCRHCTLNRTRVNAVLDDVIPNPDLIWTWGFFCDEAPKTEELMNCLTHKKWNYIISRMPHDVANGEREDEDSSRVAYLAEQFREGHKQIFLKTGIKVTNREMLAALKETSAYTHKIDELTRLVSNTDPQPIGGNELALFGTSTSMNFNIGFAPFEEATECMLAEVKELIAKKEGILPKGSPKLGCHFTPLCVPWVDRTFLKNGVSLSFSSHVSFSKKHFLPLSFADPYMIAAQLWLRNANSVNLGYHVELMAEMLQEYDIDGMLYGFFSFDRWLGPQPMTLKMIEEKSSVHHFYVEGDFWDDRNYKQTDRAGRIESIACFLKTKKLLLSE